MDFSAQNVGKPWSFGNGSGTQRFEVRQGDQLPGDASDNKERSEVYLRGRSFDAGKTYDISYEFMIEPGPPNTAKWLVLNQIQSSFDKGERGHSPPLAIGLGGERLVIDSRYDPVKITLDNNAPIKRQFVSAPLKRGEWHKLAMKVRFDPFGDGLLIASLDGRQVVDYHGPMGFNDDLGAYFKEGIYRASAPEPLAVDFRNLKIMP